MSTSPAPQDPAVRLSDYHQTIRALSDRIVEAQRPFRILDACKWPDDVEEKFFASGCKEMPHVTLETYAARPLRFDPDTKRAEFYALEKDIRRELGIMNPCTTLMLGACKEYRVVIDMLEHRGKPAFSAISQGLYGSALDRFHAGDPTIGDLGRSLFATLKVLHRDTSMDNDPRDIDHVGAVAFLKERMDAYFGPGVVEVKLSDGVVADAAAGADYIKVRQGATFSRRDLEVLAVHEGWVHVGTSVNGNSQPVCTFLGKGTPSCTVTQEGLAVIQELFTFNSLPSRIRKLADRIEAVAMAEEGADFLQVFHALVDRGAEPRAAYQTTQRAFRGSLPAGCGPFTKDLSYGRGFVMIYNFIRLAVREGRTQRIPLLFVGKLRLADMGTLAHLVDEGIVKPPRYLPTPYDDLRGIAAWMCWSNFMNTLTMDRVKEDYASLLSLRPSET